MSERPSPRLPPLTKGSDQSMNEPEPRFRVTNLRTLEKQIQQQKSGFLSAGQVQNQVPFLKKRQSSRSPKTLRAMRSEEFVPAQNQHHSLLVPNSLSAQQLPGLTASSSHDESGITANQPPLLKEYPDLARLLHDCGFQTLGSAGGKQAPQHGTSKQLQTFVYDALPLQVKEFYQSRKDFLKLMSEFDVASYCLAEVNERVRCYRYELGALLEKVAFSVQKIFERMLEATLRLHTETRRKYEGQLQENLLQIEHLDREKRALEEGNRDLRNRYMVQESLLKITKINSDALQNEIVLLHELLRKDVLNMITHLGTLEDNNAQRAPVLAAAAAANTIAMTQGVLSATKRNDATENLVFGISDLSRTLQTIESEHAGKENMLATMQSLIKAMLRGTKQDCSTQVDESELLWVPAMIVTNSRENPNPQTLALTSEELENNAIGISERFVREEWLIHSNKDLIVLREKALLANGAPLTHQQQLQAGQNTGTNRKGAGVGAAGVGDNWNLPLAMVVFLENVTRSNDSGRVIPWLHFRKLLFDIYNDRLQNDWEVQGALATTSMPFDEYVCAFFLRVHKLRRLAEMKLFEFLVSLRYYAKTWPRAATFAVQCGIAHHAPAVAHGAEGHIYRCDVYLQHYFMHSYAHLRERSAHFYEADGSTYLSRTHTIDLLSELLASFDEQVRNKVITKAERTATKKFEERPEPLFDIDRLLDLAVDEYFEAKRRLNRTLAKTFAKAFESDQGVLSFEDFKRLCRDATSQKSPFETLHYAKEITLARIFMYSLTQHRNKFDITASEFMASVQRFGLDCPYPTLRSKILQGDENQQSAITAAVGRSLGLKGAFGTRSTDAGDELSFANNTLATAATMNADAAAQLASKRDVHTLVHELLLCPDFKREDLQALQQHFAGEGEVDSVTGAGAEDDANSQHSNSKKGGKQFIKLDSTSALFAQHFSILRELRQHCRLFRESVAQQLEQDVLMNAFGNIVSILDAGCQFLNFPISM